MTVSQDQHSVSVGQDQHSVTVGQDQHFVTVCPDLSPNRMIVYQQITKVATTMERVKVNIIVCLC